MAQHWMAEGEWQDREQVTSDLEWLKKGDENDPGRSCFEGAPERDS